MVVVEVVVVVVVGGTHGVMVVVVGASVWRLTFTLASEVTTVTGLVGRVSIHTGFLVQL